MNRKPFPPDLVAPATFNPCATVSCSSARRGVHVLLCPAHFDDTQRVFVCCHGAHNRRSFRANLLCYYGDSNPTEGGRGSDSERWNWKRRGGRGWERAARAKRSQENASPSRRIRTHLSAVTSFELPQRTRVRRRTETPG